MKLLITGLLPEGETDVENHLPKGVTKILCGGGGIEMLAEKYADQHGIEKICLKEEHDHIGRIRRILEMIDMADKVLVF